VSDISGFKYEGLKYEEPLNVKLAYWQG